YRKLSSNPSGIDQVALDRSTSANCSSSGSDSFSPHSSSCEGIVGGAPLPAAPPDSSLPSPAADPPPSPPRTAQPASARGPPTPAARSPPPPRLPRTPPARVLTCRPPHRLPSALAAGLPESC